MKTKTIYKLFVGTMIMSLGLGAFAFGAGDATPDINLKKFDSDNSGKMDAQEFHEILRSALPANLAADAVLPFLHLYPDQNLINAHNADSVEEAIENLKKSSLSQLAKNTSQIQEQSAQELSGRNLDAETLLSRKPLTMVIVPGIFGEFIPTRGFEDILANDSLESQSFKAKVAELKQKNSSDATDLGYDMKSNSKIEKSLTDLVHVGAIKGKNGQTLARVVLFYTSFMSLESMGDQVEHAAIFNRRLEKYLKITGPQDLAFVGYSRGTVLGLEMLSQAKAKNLSWLPNVKAMIALGGVTWGSSLADELENPKAANFKAIQHVKKLRAEIDPNSVWKTLNAWRVFLTNMAPLAGDLQKHKITPKSSDLVASPIHSGIDANSMLSLVSNVFGKLGLSRPIREFSLNVKRFQAFLDAALSGVDSLTSRARLQWWKTHELPLSVNYYAITAAMANPEASLFDKTAFNSNYGYSNSFDDLTLLQNRLDYQGINGITLNDSQVSVAQVMFLPNAVARLNPANQGLKGKFLGTVGTHHWGLALRVVNAMRDGRQNPYPREALLKALAAKVALDTDGQ